MEQLYPLKFKPIIKNPIWGGSKLRDVLNKRDASNTSGESWEISCVEDNVSVVSNGFLADNNLSELIEIYMGDLVGEHIFEKFGTNFPLLIKFIDACDDLSIQVHPNDEIAMQRHNSFGKTEMWYVMETEPNAKLIAGFNQQVNKEIYLKHLENKNLAEILNAESVKSGDVFFIPAGRLHAIGRGILLAEIQQTSNITYRVYDYDRTDSSGKSRELHTEQAVDVIDYTFYEDYKTSYNALENKPTTIVECDYFTTNILELSKEIERDMGKIDSFVIYMVIEGEVDFLYYEQGIENLKKGETILIPAEMLSYTISPRSKSKLLEIYIPQKKKNNAN